jgi:hypothetical protein
MRRSLTLAVGYSSELSAYNWPRIPRADCIDQMSNLVRVLHRLRYDAALLKVDIQVNTHRRTGGYIRD